MMSFISKLMKSKTIIVNSLVVIAGTMTYWTNNEVIAQNPDIVAALVTAIGVINVVLRFVTKIPVSEK